MKPVTDRWWFWVALVLFLWWLWRRRWGTAVNVPPPALQTPVETPPSAIVDTVPVDSLDLPPPAVVTGSNLGPYASLSLYGITPDEISYVNTLPFVGPDHAPISLGDRWQTMWERRQQLVTSNADAASILFVEQEIYSAIKMQWPDSQTHAPV